MSLVNYRFYILDRHEHILKAIVLSCGVDAIEQTAQALLGDHVAGAAVEVWDRQRRLHRGERAMAAS